MVINENDPKDGVDILGHLYRNFKSIVDQTERMLVVGFYSNFGWATRFNNFEQQNKVFSIIADKKNRVSGQEESISLSQMIEEKFNKKMNN